MLDPPLSDNSSIAATAQWLENVLLGQVAVILAVIPVAVVGLLFLAGRMAWRQAARVVLGCAILFGAPASVVGLTGGGELNLRARRSELSAKKSHQHEEIYPPRRSEAELLSGATRIDRAKLRSGSRRESEPSICNAE